MFTLQIGWMSKKNLKWKCISNCNESQTVEKWMKMKETNKPVSLDTNEYSVILHKNVLVGYINRTVQHRALKSPSFLGKANL